MTRFNVLRSRWTPVDCTACKVEKSDLSLSEAFVLGLMVAGLQDSGRMRKEGSLCDRHGRFPHRSPTTPQPVERA